MAEWMLGLSLFVAALSGQAELLLVDGRVLEGSSVRRDGDVYVLKQEQGSPLVVPAEECATSSERLSRRRACAAGFLGVLRSRF